MGKDAESHASSPQYQVRSVDRTVQILECVAEGAGRGKPLREIARLAGIAEPTTLRYLSTLVDRGFVEHEGSREQGRYRLGLRLFSLAERALGSVDIRSLALPHMHRLLERFQETVNLAVFRNNRMVIIEVLEGLRSVRRGVRVGDEDRIRSTALGKAILASYPDDEALAIARIEPVAQCTPRTIVTEGGLLKELATVRRCGYAVDNEENEVGLRCVGVAIRPRRGEVFGLSVSGASHLFSRDSVREVGPALCEVSEAIAAQLHPDGAARR